MEELPEAALRWLEFTKRLGEAGVAIHQQAKGNRTPEQLAEVNQCLMIALCTSTLFQLRFDPNCPDWMPRLNSSLNMTGASPDFIYSTTQIDGAGTYMLNGFRGSSARMHLSVDGGMMGFSPPMDSGQSYPNYGAYEIDDFDISADGSFQILASADKPEGYSGNWIPLNRNDRTSFLLLRQISYDLETERDGWVTIRRIDQPVEQPRMSSYIEDRLAGLPDVVQRMAQAVVSTLELQDFYGSDVNSIVDYSQKFGKVALIEGQAYFGGRFAISSDQAVILEISDFEGCEYWNAQVMDSFWGDLDFMFHQASLNHCTGKVDPDGVLRLVLSEQDPGINNWLDKSSYPEVALRLRFYKGSKPTIATKIVQTSQVRDSLHPETATVTPSQRQRLIGQRIEGLQRRRRW